MKGEKKIKEELRKTLEDLIDASEKMIAYINKSSIFNITDEELQMIEDFELLFLDFADPNIDEEITQLIKCSAGRKKIRDSKDEALMHTQKVLDSAREELVKL